MTTMTNPGFYKLDQSGNVLRYATNGVYAPNFTLSAADHETYTYPIEGWHWFDTTEDAEAFFELNGASKARWQEFRAALRAIPEIQSLISTLAQADPMGHLAIGVGLGQAAQGDSTTFLGVWAELLASGLVPAAMAAQVQGLAAGFDLPAEFVAGLNPEPVTP